MGEPAPKVEKIHITRVQNGFVITECSRDRCYEGGPQWVAKDEADLAKTVKDLFLGKSVA